MVTIAVKAAHNSSHLHTWWVELMADLGRPRGDMWEVGMWEDVLAVDGDQAYYTYQVFNQAIVIPGTIDAIRALTGIEPDPTRSIAKTNTSLGLQQDFLRGPD